MAPANNQYLQADGDAMDGAANANATSSMPKLYQGVGAGVGGALFVAIVLVIIQILRKRSQHRRAVDMLDEQTERVILSAQHPQGIHEVPRPVSVARRVPLRSWHANTGWGALSSEDDASISYLGRRIGRKKCDLKSSSKKENPRIMPLRRLKHLSAIVESPQSHKSKSPSPTVAEWAEHLATADSQNGSSKMEIVKLSKKKSADGDNLVTPGSPKPEVLPSFAINSPSIYGIAIANDTRPRPSRSFSVGAMLGQAPEKLALIRPTRIERSSIHSRSVSLGAPRTLPPSRPIPPVPPVATHLGKPVASHRQAFCVSRTSSSSHESTASSVLITSPILHRPDERKPVNSPTVEEVVADDESAQLKMVLNRQWQKPSTTGPDLSDTSCIESDQNRDANISTQLPSSCGSILQYRSLSHRIPSTSSDGSQDENEDPTLNDPSSLFQIATADKVSISRVSSYNSLHSSSDHTSNVGGVQKIVTPRRVRRLSSVTAYGSPAERRKASVLREITSNAMLGTPSRQASQASSLTQDSRMSGRSSNGNPFQWDQSIPLMKPSALKGSPNSKGSQGHRRSNCVRISTLGPQILGPPPSRPTSPIMHGIQEEDGTDSEEGTTRPFVSNRSMLRVSSTNSLAANLRVQPVRVSLTPSSPTLSAWAAYQDQVTKVDRVLPNQPSDSQLSISPLHLTSNGRLSRTSNRSSVLSIPSFPSPSRAPVSPVQIAQPIPEFYVSRPSGEEYEDNDHFTAQEFLGSGEAATVGDGERALPCNALLPTSKLQEYDPTWPGLALTPPHHPQEYDPASPNWPLNDGKHTQPPNFSSPSYFPFPSHSHSDTPTKCSSGTSSVANSPLEGVESIVTPLCSPRNRPGAFGGSRPSHLDQNLVLSSTLARSTIADKLTSSNASAIMATIPENPPSLGLPETVPVPVLAPPTERTSTITIRRPQGPRAVSRVTDQNPLFATAPSCTQYPAGLEETPSPLQVKAGKNSSAASPKGPRSEPAKSVLKNAMALRRMNSEIDQTRDAYRGSRRYICPGRGASPLLPFIGSPDPNDSSNDLFDFDFAYRDVHVGAEEVEAEKTMSALDDIELEALDKQLDGVLAGFEADSEPSLKSDMVSDNSFLSVWEDGEHFWTRQKRFRFAPGSSSPANVTPPRRNCLVTRDGAVTPTQQLIMPEMEGPNSIVRTPRSLYDSMGFLRE